MKKVFAIILTMVFLFITIVPSFAFIGFTVQSLNRTRVVGLRCTVNEVDGGYYCFQNVAGDSIVTIYDCVFLPNHNYFILVHPLEGNQYTLSVNLYFNSTLITRLTSFLNDGYLIYSPASRFSNFIVDPGNFLDGNFNFSANIFDLTEMYGDHIPTAQEFYNIIVENNLLLNQPFGESIDVSPINNFSQSLFSIFDYFEDLTTYYRYPIIVISMILGITGITLVIILAIKRFKI